MSSHLSLPVPSGWSLDSGLGIPSGIPCAIELSSTQTVVFTTDANTKLLLHLDGTDGSTTYTDSSGLGKTVTPSGTAALSTTGPKGGSACSKNTGTGYFYVAADSDWSALNAGSWTLEFWVRIDTINTFQELFSWGSWGSAGAWMSESDASGNINFYGLGSMPICTVVLGGGWHHYCMVKNGSVFTFYWDGVQKGTATFTQTVNGQALYFGHRTDGFPTRDVVGRYDEVRISNIARYTDAFTPGALVYPATSPIAESPWIAIAGNTINNVSDAIVVWENVLATAMAKSAGTLTYDYALNNGSYTGTFVSQATMLTALKNTTISDHTNSIKLKVKFTSDSTQAADIVGGYLNVADPSGGATGTPVTNVLQLQSDGSIKAVGTVAHPLYLDSDGNIKQY